MKGVKQMSKVYGYCRVSTKKQNVERQIKNVLDSFPNAVIVTETYTGTTNNRPCFDKLIRNIKPGDTIVFDEVSRMSRNAEEGYELYKELYAKGIELVFIKQHSIDTATYREAMQKQINVQVNTGDKKSDKFITNMMNVLNEFLLDVVKEQIKIAFEQAQEERDMLSRRTSDGVQRAIALGKQVGRTNGSKVVTNKQKEMIPQIRHFSKRYDGMLNDKETMEHLRLSRNTYYKYLKAMGEENAD